MLGPAATDANPPVTITGDVVFSCLKGAEDGNGLILRCFNPGDAPAHARIAGDFQVSRARLDETAHDGGFELAPGQIGTFRLTVDGAAA